MGLVPLQRQVMTALAIIVLFFNILRCIAQESKTELCIKKKMRARPRTSLQTQSYVALAHDSDVFVDKSLFIKDIMNDKNKKILITCPRRWGKTVVLDMAREFFEIKVDENGTRIPVESATNYDLFVNGNISRAGKALIKELTKPPLIGRDKVFVEKYLGRFPVVKIDIGYFPHNPGLLWIMKGTLNQITIAFEQHIYLRNILESKIAQKTDPRAPDLLSKFNKVLKIVQTIPVEEVAQSFVFLCRLLNEHFKSKVILLFDVYDESFDAVCGEPWCSNEDREEFLKFYENLMEHTLNKNDYLEKAIVLGIEYPPEAFMKSIFAESSTTICNVLTGTYMEYFGFNQLEMQQLYAFHRTNASTQKEMQEWYGGHKVNKRNLEIFVPYSVVHAFRRKRIEWYWARTLKIQLTVLNYCELDTFAAKLDKLCNGSVISISLKREYFNYRDWIETSRVFQCNEDGPLHGDELTDRGIFLFFMHGYLTLAKEYNPMKDRLNFRLKIPNQEILLTLKKDLQKFHKEGPKKWTGIDI